MVNNGGSAASGLPTGAGGACGSDVEDVALDEVRRALREIDYGSVLIKIHQGEVVGIETSRKVRLKGT